MTKTPPSMAGQFAAPLFVVLWSTGFIGAKLGLPHAEPLTFLSWRFVIVASLLGGWAILSGDAWPKGRQILHVGLVGILLHTGYLGGVFCAIWLGTEAGVSALIVSVQPILTAVLAQRFLGEPMTRMKWAGLALGIAGVALVVSEKIDHGPGSWLGIALCILALFSISCGTLYQKKFCAEMPLRSGGTIQYIAAMAVTAPLALLLETNEVSWNGEFIFALAWLSLVLSVGAFGLLITLIKRGAANEVASLFFLVPPCTAIFAWFLFDETLGRTAILGMLLTVVGVACVIRGKST